MKVAQLERCGVEAFSAELKLGFKESAGFKTEVKPKVDASVKLLAGLVSIDYPFFSLE